MKRIASEVEPLIPLKTFPQPEWEKKEILLKSYKKWLKAFCKANKKDPKCCKGKKCKKKKPN